MNTDGMPAGREMDALVAEKVMGLELTNYSPIGIRKGGWVLPIPNYSTDIAAAWEVVGKLGRDGINLWAIGETAQEDVDGPWQADFGRNYQSDQFAFAPTAPLAICRAALKAVGL